MWAQHQVCPSPDHQTRVSVRPEPAQPQGEARPAPGLWAAMVVQGKPPHTSPHHTPSVCTGLGILGLHGPLSSLREFSDPHCLLGTNLDVRAWGSGFPSRSLFLGWPVIKPGVTCGWVRGPVQPTVGWKLSLQPPTCLGREEGYLMAYKTPEPTSHWGSKASGGPLDWAVGPGWS